MGLFLVPPHGDFTVTWPAPPGFEGLDAGRDFIRRALEPAELDAAAARLERSLADAGADGPFRLLQLRAALQLEEEGRDLLRWLRAATAALPGLSATSPVRLALDDIQLASGTTERSGDALAAAPRSGAPHQPELDAAAERARGAKSVRLWLQVDQQLPAVLFLAQALEGRPLELGGRFALTHRAALARLDVLRTCQFVEEGLEALPLLVGAPGLPVEGTPPRWREFEDIPVTGDAPWAGRVTLAELTAPERLAASGCRVAVLPFASAEDGVLGTDGDARSRAEVQQATSALRARGVRVVGEWWIGAPGVTVEMLERSAARLEQAPLFDWIAALRHFHWPVARPGGRWGSIEIQLGEPAPDRDLARTRPVLAPSVLSPAERAEQIERLGARLRQRAPLIPGRVALAYLADPQPTPPRGPRIQLDPDCAIVPLPVTLEGEPKPTTYAANLRTGVVLKMDPRLAPVILKLRDAALPGEALGALPEAQRAMLVKVLVDKSVLREVT